jgi:hypothetical protein
MERLEDFFPVILRTEPPTVMTREDMERYFRERGTTVNVMHIAATNPQEERIDVELYRK